MCAPGRPALFASPLAGAARWSCARRCRRRLRAHAAARRSASSTRPPRDCSPRRSRRTPPPPAATLRSRWRSAPPGANASRCMPPAHSGCPRRGHTELRAGQLTRLEGPHTARTEPSDHAHRGPRFALADPRRPPRAARAGGPRARCGPATPRRSAALVRRSACNPRGGSPDRAWPGPPGVVRRPPCT